MAKKGEQEVIAEERPQDGCHAAGSNVEPEQARMGCPGDRGDAQAQTPGLQRPDDLPQRDYDQAKADDDKDQIAAGLRVDGLHSFTAHLA
jgi:hypothetical protein